MVMEKTSCQFCVQMNVDSIPALKASKIRLLEALQHEDADIDCLSDAISTDPAMTAKIIRLANSPFYRHARQHFGLHQSLLTIGMDMVKCIALSMAVMDSLGCEIKYARSLWSHSYATALIALSLSSDHVEKDRLFTGALLHDLGRMVFLSKAPEAYSSLFEFEGYWPDMSLENDVFAIDHTVLGETVARAWHFPEETIEVIRNHHKPASRTSALVYLINHVINQYEKGDQSATSPGNRLIHSYLGDMYKDLVNLIIQRYKINAVIIENLF